MSEETGSWELLKFDNDYEIYTEYPYPIQRVGKDWILKESYTGNGYLHVKINGRDQNKHRLIALQFVNNDDPDTKTQVDHIDRNKSNNHIDNLRWISPSENTKNKNKYKCQVAEYLDELPEDVIEISDYEGIELKDYYYDAENERIIKIIRFPKTIKVKVIKPYLQNKLLVMTFIDLYGRGHNRSYNKVVKNIKEVLN
jgi:hypothetical protein